MRMQARAIFIALLLTSLVGCSANRLIYNRADTFVRWAVDDYVSFDREQQAAFDSRLDDFLSWHRREELPRYRLFILKSMSALDNGVTLDEAVEISVEIEHAADRFQAQFIELLLATGEGLSDAQIQDFLEELEANQAEYAEENLDRDEDAYYADSAKTMMDLVKRLMGRLSREQRTEIEDRSRQLRRIDALWHEDRSRWGRTLRDLLEARSPGWQAAVRQLGATRAEVRSPEYAAGIEHNGDIILSLLVDIINSRTERQDRRMRRFLEGLIEDIDALTRDLVAEGLVVEQG